MGPARTKMPEVVMIRWMKRIVVALLVLAALATAAVWTVSERVLHRSYADVSIAAPPLAGNVESGRHWATILGCTDCHGTTLHGNVVIPDSFLFGALVAPNLTVQRKVYDDAALARMIRYGIKRDGTGVQMMPSQAFYHLDDATVADLIAFVRSVPDDANALRASGNGPATRLFLLAGVFKLAP